MATNTDYSRAWRQKNPERARELNREAQRRWIASHPEEHRAKSRRYRQTHREKVIGYILGWQKRNPDKMREYAQRREARKRENGGIPPTPQDLQGRYQEQGGCCFYCGADLRDGKHLDHVIPLAKGGRHEIENLVWACPSCSCHKQALLPEQFFAYRG